MYEQYSVYWVELNPTKGGEMNKVRPCVILSPTTIPLLPLRCLVQGLYLGLQAIHQ